MQNNFQIISNWLYAINKYVTIHNYKSIVDTIWELSGVVMLICIVFFALASFSILFTYSKNFLKDITTFGITFGVSTVIFISLLFGKLYFKDKLISVTDNNPKVVQKATNNLNHSYKKVIRIDTNRQIYLYFTNDTNKINSIKALSTNNTVISLTSDNKGVLVLINYDSDFGHLESYRFIKSPITISSSDNNYNDIEIFNTNNVPISNILSRNASKKTRYFSAEMNCEIVFRFLLHYILFCDIIIKNQIKEVY